jgi:hypothetical protein
VAYLCFVTALYLYGNNIDTIKENSISFKKYPEAKIRIRITLLGSSYHNHPDPEIVHDPPSLT